MAEHGTLACGGTQGHEKELCSLQQGSSTPSPGHKQLQILCAH